MNANDIDNLDKLFDSIGGLKPEEKIFLKGKMAGECIFGVGNETRIKMRFDYSNGMCKELFETDMTLFKAILDQSVAENRDFNEVRVEVENDYDNWKNNNKAETRVENSDTKADDNESKASEPDSKAPDLEDEEFSPDLGAIFGMGK
jgi:hypothetical protein